MSSRERREAYLRSAGRFHQLVAEGFIAFGIHQGGRSPYTPMAELTRLCAITPDVDVSDVRPEELRKPCAPEDGDRESKVLRARAAGMKTVDIAREMGIPHSSVRTILYRLGKVKKWERRA